jgi:hypothetical protein
MYVASEDEGGTASSPPRIVATQLSNLADVFSTMVHEEQLIGILDGPALHNGGTGWAWHRRLDMPNE